MPAKSNGDSPAVVRRVETEVHETGVGVTNRTDVTYELGAEIDGVWCSFATIGQNRVDLLKTAAASAEESESAEASAEG